MNYLKSVQYVCFAPIDMKNADFYLYDGFRVTGVTNTAEEPAAETVVALSNCDEIVPVGCAVKFANDSTETEYVVESRTTSGGVSAIYQIDLDSSSSGSFTLTYGGQVTNSIAYDAAVALIQLELEALDGIGNGDVLVEAGTGGYDIDITFQDDLASTPITGFTFQAGTLNGSSPAMTQTTAGVADDTTLTITLTEGLAEVVEAGGAVTFLGRRLYVKIGEGNLSFDENQNVDYILDRGVLDTTRLGDEVPMDVSFDFVWEFLSAVSGSGIPTVEEVLKHDGEASDWESTAADTCEPYCVDLVLVHDAPCTDTGSQEKITLPYFRHEKLSHSLRDSQVSCTGKCNATKAIKERI